MTTLTDITLATRENEDWIGQGRSVLVSRIGHPGLEKDRAYQKLFEIKTLRDLVRLSH